MNYIIIVDKHIKQMYICPSYIRRGQIMSNQKLNGSVTILAKAFHGVITDAVKPLHVDIKETKSSIDKINTCLNKMEKRFERIENKVQLEPPRSK